MERDALMPAKDLTQLQRQVAESILGGPIDDDEVIAIRSAKAILVKPAASSQEKAAILTSVQARAARIEAAAHPVSEEEESAVLAEALAASRLSRG